MKDNLKIVAKLGSTYGVRGYLRIYSFTEQSESIFDYQPWFMSKNNQIVKIELEDWHHHKQDLVVKLKGIDSKEEAQKLTNIEILVDRNTFPILDDEFYWQDLIGLSVKNEAGYDMGEVVELFETGSNDVLVVKAREKDAFNMQERLIPYLDNVVKRVDLNNKLIVVDWDANF